MTPSGLPAWTRTASHTQYGGDLNKRNFQSQGVINAQTDVGAEEIARLAADLEACVRTAAFAVITLTATNDGGLVAPTVNAVLLMSGIRATSYPGAAAPSGFPSCATIGAGHYQLTFASSYSDAYGVAGSVNLIGGTGSVLASTMAVPTIIASDANADGINETVDVYVWDSSGVALANQTVLFDLFNT